MPEPVPAPVCPRKLALRHAADAAILFVLAYAFLLIAMDRRVNLFDEGIILVGASRVADGEIVHRDFYTLYGPLNYYLIAGLFKLFGPAVLVERLWDTAVKAVAVVLVYLI